MTSSDLIAALRLHHVTLAADGDRLLIDGPENGVVDDAAIMWHVRDRKAELLAILTSDWIGAVRALMKRERPDEADAWIEQFEERVGIYQSDTYLEQRLAEELAYYELADGILEAEIQVEYPTRADHTFDSRKTWMHEYQGLKPE